MIKGKLIILSGIITTIAVAIVLGWSGYIFFKLEQRTLAEHAEQLIQETADKTREKNRTLNNLMAMYNEEDGAEKNAFAIGMTGNIGRMHINFDEDEETKNKKDADTSVLHINKDTLVNMGIKFIPTAVYGISYFDSLLKDTLGLEKLDLQYTIVPQRRGSENTFFKDSTADLYSYHCRPFVINYYKPDVFRVNYSLSTLDIISNMWHYILAAIFILLLVPAAFIMYYRAYNLQAQAGSFKETLFSNITHELKTPLSSLQLIIESITKNNTTDADAEKLMFATSELNRMKLIVDKILSYGKLNSDEFALNAEIVDMATVLSDAANAMKIVGEQANAVVKYEAATNLKLTGDRTLLVNMFTSLIDNAIKYNSSAQPQVHINAEKESNNIIVTVADNGIGIEEEYMKKIFDPFFRIPTGNIHNVKGNGIGLSFVSQIVKLHNGTINVSCQNDNGSIFIITLPL